MTQPTIELLPCPFCGGKATMHDNDIGDYYVECFVCGAETSDHRCEEPKHAAERWNRRTALTAQSANTLPLDEVPKGWRLYSLCNNKAPTNHFVCWLRQWNDRFSDIDATGETPAEALRAAIAKTKQNGETP